MTQDSRKEKNCLQLPERLYSRTYPVVERADITWTDGDTIRAYVGGVYDKQLIFSIDWESGFGAKLKEQIHYRSLDEVISYEVLED